jgi:hypothetical protein
VLRSNQGIVAKTGEHYIATVEDRGILRYRLSLLTLVIKTSSCDLIIVKGPLEDPSGDQIGDRL